MFAFQPSRRSRERPAIPRSLKEKATPVVAASARTLPVNPALAPLVPGGSLRRGATTVLAGLPGLGATSLGISLMAEASSRGHWCAAIGFSDPGVIAMAELGLDLRRAVFVPRPRAGWAEATAELFDGVELVLLRPPERVPHGAARRLMARARERRVALIIVTTTLTSWPISPEVAMRVTTSSWQGIGRGDGRLSARRAEVEVHARHGACRDARFTIWLPSPTGGVSMAEPGR